jgi:hypothetical protein
MMILTTHVFGSGTCKGPALLSNFDKTSVRRSARQLTQLEVLCVS